jgi:hypothetical protein
MRNKKTTTSRDLTDQINSILSTRPALAERILSILKLADEPLESGKIRSADEVESLLIDELRKLGNESLSSWAGGVDGNISSSIKSENAQANLREKKLSNGGLDLA